MAKNYRERRESKGMSGLQIRVIISLVLLNLCLLLASAATIFSLQSDSSPLEIFTRLWPSSIPETPAPPTISDFVNYAKKVAIVSPDYGGQYILKETIQIRSTIEVSPTEYQTSQGVTQIICVGYSFSAIQASGRRINNVNRAINIYLQNGSFWHKQLDTENCSRS